MSILIRILDSLDILYSRFSKYKLRRKLSKLAIEAVRMNKGDNHSKTVLFYSRGSRFTIISEVLMALILRHSKTRIVFVICDKLPVCNFTSEKKPLMPCNHCNSGKNIPESFGFETYSTSDLVKYDSIIFNDLSTIDDCVSFFDGDVNIGQLLLPSILRYFLVNSVDDINDKQQLLEVYNNFIKSSLMTAKIVQAVITKYDPDRVMIFNGLYGQMRSAYEFFTRNGKRVITYENIGAPKGTNWLLSNTSPALALNFEVEWDNWKKLSCPQPYWDRYKKTREIALQKRIEMDPPFALDDAVLLLTNVSWDISSILMKSPFDSIFSWVIETIQDYIKTNRKLVVRIHPSDIGVYESNTVRTLMDVVDDHFDNIPENIWIIPPEAKISSYDLIEKCRRVSVWSSTMGMEMAYFGREPVVVTNVHYSRKGFTRDIFSKDDYFKSLLEEIDTLSAAQKQLANRYSSLFLLRKKIPLGLVKTERPFSFEIKDIASHYADYDPSRNLVFKFFVDGVLQNKEFVLDDELIAATYHDQSFPM